MFSRSIVTAVYTTNTIAQMNNMVHAVTEPSIVRTILEIGKCNLARNEPIVSIKLNQIDHGYDEVTIDKFLNFNSSYKVPPFVDVLRNIHDVDTTFSKKGLILSIFKQNSDLEYNGQLFRNVHCPKCLRKLTLIEKELGVIVHPHNCSGC